MSNKTLDFKKYQGVFLKVTKTEDRRFFGNHPNGVEVGRVETGLLHLENSNKYQCLFILDGPDRYFHTSQVLEIDEHEGYDLLKTLNSTYKVEFQIVSIPGTQQKYPMDVADSKDKS
jgi:hypothetical protein